MWTANVDYVRIRLKAEILNQGVGVEHGERAEAELDPAIQRALAVLSEQHGSQARKSQPAAGSGN